MPAWSKNMKGAGNPDFARHQKCRAQGLFTYPFSEQRELVSHLRIVLISQRRRIVAGEAGIAILRTDIRTLCRSEEHTSELQSLMRNSYAVFCLKKKN